MEKRGELGGLGGPKKKGGRENGNSKETIWARKKEGPPLQAAQRRRNVDTRKRERLTSEQTTSVKLKRRRAPGREKCWGKENQGAYEPKGYEGVQLVRPGRVGTTDDAKKKACEGVVSGARDKKKRKRLQRRTMRLYREMKKSQRFEMEKGGPHQNKEKRHTEWKKRGTIP